MEEISTLGVLAAEGKVSASGAISGNQELEGTRYFAVGLDEITIVGNDKQVNDLKRKMRILKSS